jgi:hypothetical protein
MRSCHHIRLGVHLHTNYKILLRNHYISTLYLLKALSRIDSIAFISPHYNFKHLGQRLAIHTMMSIIIAVNIIVIKNDATNVPSIGTNDNQKNTLISSLVAAFAHFAINNPKYVISIDTTYAMIKFI